MATRCCSEIYKQTGSQSTSSLLGLVPPLGAQLAQDSQGSSFLAEVAGEFWGPTQGRLPSSLPLCAQLDSLPDKQREAQVSPGGEPVLINPTLGGALPPSVLRWSSEAVVAALWGSVVGDVSP